MDLVTDGAVLHAGAVRDDLAAVLAMLVHLPTDRPGVRIDAQHGLVDLLSVNGAIGRIAATSLGPRCFPVRAVLFDKRPGTNWSLGWHQDRTICVRRRIDVEGFGPWSLKSGIQHVEPPFALLEAMRTLRVHLDPVTPDNAPLRIACGSHRLGRIPVGAVAGVVAQSATAICLAQAGDIWMYATPILHASDTARIPARRRVLQLDYAAQPLPGDLEWQGV